MQFFSRSLFGVLLLILCLQLKARIRAGQPLPVDPKVKPGKLTNALAYPTPHNFRPGMETQKTLKEP